MAVLEDSFNLLNKSLGPFRPHPLFKNSHGLFGIRLFLGFVDIILNKSLNPYLF
jgi:hypothetical protein